MEKTTTLEGQRRAEEVVFLNIVGWLGVGLEIAIHDV
jgi:hypothetical protein